MASRIWASALRILNPIFVFSRLNSIQRSSYRGARAQLPGLSCGSGAWPLPNRSQSVCVTAPIRGALALSLYLQDSFDLLGYPPLVSFPKLGIPRLCSPNRVPYRYSDTLRRWPPRETPNLFTICSHEKKHPKHWPIGSATAQASPRQLPAATTLPPDAQSAPQTCPCIQIPPCARPTTHAAPNHLCWAPRASS
jgi:hypothetical protein